MRRCGVVSAIHGLRRVVLGRFVVLRHVLPSCPRRSGRPSLLVKISVAPGSISTGRCVSHVPVQFGKQQVVDRDRSDTGRGLGRA